MPVIVLCLLTSNKNHLFCLLISNKSIIFAHAQKVSDTLQLIVKTKRINTFNTLAGRFCL